MQGFPPSFSAGVDYGLSHDLLRDVLTIMHVDGEGVLRSSPFPSPIWWMLRLRMSGVRGSW